MPYCIDCGEKLAHGNAKRCPTHAKIHNRVAARERARRLRETPEGRAKLAESSKRANAKRYAEDPEGRRAMWRESQARSRARRRKAKAAQTDGGDAMAFEIVKGIQSAGKGGSAGSVQEPRRGLH